ncbi:hypothetical protein ACS0TY_010505 [Phlomoides rotata]
MEVPPSAPNVARNGGFTMPPMPSSSSQPSRKEWRVVPEQSLRNSANEELDRSKLVQSDERLIYEHGRELADVDFCSITIDGGLDNNILQQRLHALVKQREELQQMEIELHAQNIARSEILRMQNTFDTQIKEHGNANCKLQEQLHEKEQKLHELERKMEEKERELHAIRLDNEAAWAKEDLLREQSKELQSYRRERDNSEAERVQHITQIRELQEHIQEKDRLLMELQEQHRIAQETILYKEEQLREAQTWLTRAQEMDALLSTTNHSLQAELRDRTEHYNQLWLGYQRQLGDMERLHLHIQQLQLELADVREKSGSNLDGSHLAQTNLKDASELGHNNGSDMDVNGSIQTSAYDGGVHGNSESASGVNASTQDDNVPVVAFAPSLLGMPTYVPPGQVTTLHPFVMHQHGVPHPSHVMQSHFHSVSAMPSIQNWQQAQPDGQHVPTHGQYAQEPEQKLLSTDSHRDYEASGNGQIHHANNVITNISGGLDVDSVVPSANGDGQVLDSVGKTYDNTHSPQGLEQISSHFHDGLGLDHLEHGNGEKEKEVNPLSDHGIENKSTTMEHPKLAGNASSSEAPKNISEKVMNDVSSAEKLNAFVSAGQKNVNAGKTEESYVLDERALLASIARTIGSSGRIRISSTLPNRLGKMLAPLHWHDYKKKYGKLDDFVASHPELFFIEGDYIQLREGAQGIIAATAAVAKVAAAAAAPSSYSSLVPSVALTPMAQSHRLKKASSHELSHVNTGNATSNEFADRPQYSVLQSQSTNGGSVRVAGGNSNVKILSKTQDHFELNGNETRLRSAVPPVGNGDKTDFSQSKGASHGRPSMSSVGKQQSRAIGAASSLRR